MLKDLHRCIFCFVPVSDANHFIQPQGCYLDSITSSEFGQRKGSADNSYTPPICMQLCREDGKKYAAVLRWIVSLISNHI